MTEQEAIDILGEFQTDKPILEMYYGECHEEALSMAISALDKMQQYRALGTVEELGKVMQKQRVRKPHIGIRGFIKCQYCQSLLRKTDKFCHECGQAIDWEE